MNHRNQVTDRPGQSTGTAPFRQAQEGCRNSLARLMAAHKGLVPAVVRKQVLGHLPFAEALQAARIGLWRAILGFDPERGHAFSTYTWTSIMHHVWREVKLAERRAIAFRNTTGATHLDNPENGSRTALETVLSVCEAIGQVRCTYDMSNAIALREALGFMGGVIGAFQRLVNPDCVLLGGES
jgi:hypothetical protein